jgi:transposase InsO family protein
MTLTEAYPVEVVCAVLDLPRSSYYYRAQAEDEADLKVALRRLAGEWPTYGYRRLTRMLRREGWVVNPKHVTRLMHELDLAGEAPRRTPHSTHSQHDYGRYPNLVGALAVVRPDQVWVADITYVGLRQEFVYLAVLMDVFTRAIRGWQLSRHLDQDLTLSALNRALAHATPQIHHSDQGVQYAATAYVERLEQVGTQISMAAVGEPRENGYAERLMRTIKEEEIALNDYLDFHDAYTHIGHFLDVVYQHKRIHSALGYLTPAEFEAQCRRQQPNP